MKILTTVAYAKTQADLDRLRKIREQRDAEAAEIHRRRRR